MMVIMMVTITAFAIFGNTVLVFAVAMTFIAVILMLLLSSLLLSLLLQSYHNYFYF